jgi:hypothetical protein
MDERRLEEEIMGNGKNYGMGKWGRSKAKATRIEGYGDMGREGISIYQYTIIMYNVCSCSIS